MELVLKKNDSSFLLSSLAHFLLLGNLVFLHFLSKGLLLAENTIFGFDDVFLKIVREQFGGIKPARTV